MKAQLQNTLVYMDGPQVMLLRRAKGRIIAVAVEKEGMDYPFFAAKVTKRVWDLYQKGKADLYYVFEKSGIENYYFFDLSKEKNGTVELIVAKKDEFENKDFWPERGFFSNYHTERISENNESDASVQVFKIDGAWEAVDFSSFYSKLSDLYAIFYAKRKLSDPNSASGLISSIRNSVQDKMWRGGGSYQGFYGNFMSVLPSMLPLRVSKIQYASPGQIDVQGDAEILDDVVDIIELGTHRIEEAQKAYNDVDRILSKEKLKKARPHVNFSSKTIEDFVKKRCDKILTEINFDNQGDLFRSCDENVLVYAKVVLSIFRRLRGIQKFFAEGRLATHAN